MSTDNYTPNSEQWIILDFNPRYAVSNYGFVKRIEKGKGARADKILGLRLNTRGYPEVMLYNDGKAKAYKVHRLIAYAFLGECPTGLQVNHKNGIKTDNRIENLEYMTAKQNTRHSFDVLGKQVERGSKHGNSKLTESLVYQIKQLRHDGVKVKVLSVMFGVNEAQISAITLGRQWKHVQFP